MEQIEEARRIAAGLSRLQALRRIPGSGARPVSRSLPEPQSETADTSAAAFADFDEPAASAGPDGLFGVAAGDAPPREPEWKPASQKRPVPAPRPIQPRPADAAEALEDRSTLADPLSPMQSTEQFDWDMLEPPEDTSSYSDHLGINPLRGTIEDAEPERLDLPQPVFELPEDEHPQSEEDLSAFAAGLPVLEFGEDEPGTFAADSPAEEPTRTDTAEDIFAGFDD